MQNRGGGLDRARRSLKKVRAFGLSDEVGETKRQKEGSKFPSARTTHAT